MTDAGGTPVLLSRLQRAFASAVLMIDQPATGWQKEFMPAEKQVGTRIPFFRGNAQFQGNLPIHLFVYPQRFIKNIIMVLGLVMSLSALVTGCGAKPSKSQRADSASHLNADELARLLDFHAWKIPIPQSLQPSSGIRLVFVKSDGTTVKACGFGTTVPPKSWSNILVGLRLDRGAFMGTLEARDSKGDATAWPFSFTNIISSDRPRSWVLGSALWKGNRAELADLWESDRSGGGRDETNYSVLAVELVK